MTKRGKASWKNRKWELDVFGSSIFLTQGIHIFSSASPPWVSTEEHSGTARLYCSICQGKGLLSVNPVCTGAKTPLCTVSRISHRHRGWTYFKDTPENLLRASFRGIQIFTTSIRWMSSVSWFGTSRSILGHTGLDITILPPQWGQTVLLCNFPPPAVNSTITFMIRRTLLASFYLCRS